MLFALVIVTLVLRRRVTCLFVVFALALLVALTRTSCLLLLLARVACSCCLFVFLVAVKLSDVGLRVVT